MVEYIPTLPFLVVKILVKGQVDLGDILQIALLHIFDKELGVSLSEGFGVQDADVLGMELLFVEGLVLLVRVAVVLLPEKLNLVERVQVLQPVPGLRHRNMKQPPRQASLPLNKLRNILRVKYHLQQFTIFLQNLNRNRRLHLPHKLIYLPLLQPHQYLLRLKYPPPHIPIVLRLLLIQPLHTLQYAISQRHVLVNPLLALLYVLADCCELEDGLDQLQHVHYHELHAL